MSASGEETAGGEDIRDLGEIGGPLIVCGGIYGNLEALDALLAEADRLGLPSSRVIHTGDVAAYCADPRACAERIRELGLVAIRGNIEEQLATGAEDCGCGFEEDSACAVMADEWFAYVKNQMTDELRGWMRGLPRHLVLTLRGNSVRVVHGGVDNISEYVFGSAPAGVFRAVLEQAGTDVVLAGHTGLPFTRFIGGRVWHNTGSLGMPANDGTPRVWYSLVRPDGDRIVFEHRALTYDYRKTAAKLREAGLPDGYARCLETGLWPSLDILPRAERAARGKPIALRPQIWTGEPAGA